MVEKRDESSRGIVVGGLGGAALGALFTALLLGKPAEAAPPQVTLDYIIQLLEQLAQGNVAIVTLLEQVVAAMGVAPPGIEVTVKTPWIAKDPEQIYSNTIRAIGTFFSDTMVDWTKGKRLAVVVQSSLDQPCNTQLIGNYVDDMNRATTVGAVWPCPANSNISIRPAWDDWMPFIGVRITTAIAPAAGILNIWAVIQE